MTNSSQLQQQKAAARDKRRFISIRYDGHVCVCEPQEAPTMLEGCEGAVVREVWMTEDEWENLQEFTGW